MHTSGTTKIIDSDLNTWFGEFLHENQIIDIPQKTRKTSNGEYNTGYTCPIEPIMNSALQSLIVNGVDITLIAKINGVSESAIISKFSKDKKTGEFIHRLINNEISKNYYYKYI